MDPCPKGERFRWHLTKSGTYKTYRCESLRCPVCARAASDRLAVKIGSWAAERKLRRFWTFTLDPSRIPGVNWTGAPLSGLEVKAAVAYLRRTWNKYLTAWRRDDPALEYIAVLELQLSGAPHLHVLVNGWYPWARMQRRWIRMGGGSHVRVNGVRGGAEGVTRYMAKYMAKNFTDSRLLRHKAYLFSRNCYRPVVDKIALVTSYFYQHDLSTMSPLQDLEFQSQWLGKGRYRMYNLNNNNEIPR